MNFGEKVMFILRTVPQMIHSAVAAVSSQDATYPDPFVLRSDTSFGESVDEVKAIVVVVATRDEAFYKEWAQTVVDMQKKASDITVMNRVVAGKRERIKP